MGHGVRFICAMMTQVPMTSGAKTASRRATPTLRMRPKTTCSASSDVAAKLADALKKTPKEATAADPRIEVLEGKITEALKEAEECVTDCGVEWDLVEELEEAVDRLKA